MHINKLQYDDLILGRKISLNFGGQTEVNKTITLICTGVGSIQVKVLEVEELQRGQKIKVQKT